MSDWISVASLSELPPGTMRRVEIEGRWIVVGRARDLRVFATDLLCPHRGGPLDEGSIVGDLVVCPWHMWEFEIESGRCTRFPEVRAKMHETRIDAETVFVRLTEQE